MLERVLEEFGIWGNVEISPLETGLINRTWKISDAGQDYILQKVNHNIFTNPQAIADNIESINLYLQQQASDFIFPPPISTTNGQTLVQIEKDYYRVFPFVPNTHSKDVVTSAKQAYQAARAFGKFTHTLARFDAQKLKETLPNFHDLAHRFQQFMEAITYGYRDRITQTQPLIQELLAQKEIVEKYKQIRQSHLFKIRVTHHDTKISNVLFDDQDNSICVIDLDTVMPGYFISDLGDMMRTYLSPVSEEETDFSKIQVREEYFKAIVCGYLHYMNEDLAEEEKQSFVYAGKFMIYMQALRFLTDHLNGDTYYGAAYPGHNLARAQNQAVLLRQLCQQENSLQVLVTEALENFESYTTT